MPRVAFSSGIPMSLSRTVRLILFLIISSANPPQPPTRCSAFPCARVCAMRVCRSPLPIHRASSMSGAISPSSWPSGASDLTSVDYSSPSFSGLFLKENATEVEGVFRINGSNKRMRDLQSIFESPPRYGKDLNWKHESYTSHDVASVFRRYLTQMPCPGTRHSDRAVPCCTYSTLPRVSPTIHAHPVPPDRSKSENDVIQTYRKLIKEMPRANQYLLLYVLDLLSVFARKSDKNLMTESSTFLPPITRSYIHILADLAVIFRPGIISLPAHEMKPTEHALSQQVLVFLIQHQDHFMLDPPARGDSIMLSAGMSPGIERNTYIGSHPGQFSPGVERPGYIVPSDTDCILGPFIFRTEPFLVFDTAYAPMPFYDPPPGGYKLVERRRDPTTGSLARRRSFHDPGTNLGPLTTEPESIGSESPVTTESGGGGGKVKRSRTVPSQRGASVLDSSNGSKRRMKRLDTLGSVGSTVESGAASTLSGVGGSAIEHDSAPTPTSSTVAVVNAAPPAGRPSTS
ncbi:rho GTPase-activating protein [Rhizoctonia solani AG-1 IA]|uniref:Rho GTPase-activating protein n=1 Tax=Thanatephorus cucumeris (strain AG1-IA) TaxID=983506 RepID=L8WGD3_THACA|nr:rho GTPase-activating protein [Rhizoctonia solani AG-1 IA]